MRAPACRPLGFHKITPEKPERALRVGHVRAPRPQVHDETSRERRKNEIAAGQEKKQTQNSGPLTLFPPPFEPPPSWPPTFAPAPSSTFSWVGPFSSFFLVFPFFLLFFVPPLTGSQNRFSTTSKGPKSNKLWPPWFFGVSVFRSPSLFLVFLVFLFFRFAVFDVFFRGFPVFHPLFSCFLFSLVFSFCVFSSLFSFSFFEKNLFPLVDMSTCGRVDVSVVWRRGRADVWSCQRADVLGDQWISLTPTRNDAQRTSDTGQGTVAPARLYHETLQPHRDHQIKFKEDMTPKTQVVQKAGRSLGGVSTTRFS